MNRVLNGFREGILVFLRSGKIMFANDYILDELHYGNTEVNHLECASIVRRFNDKAGDFFHELYLYEGKQVPVELNRADGGVSKYKCIPCIMNWQDSVVVVLHIDIDGIFSIMDTTFQSVFKNSINNKQEIISSKELQDKLRGEMKKSKEAELELELFIEASVDLVTIVDYQGNFTKINSRWTEALGWSKEEMLSFNAEDIMYKEDIPEYRRKIADAGKTEEILNSRNRFICKDGSIRYLEWKAKYSHRLNKYICTAKDVTERIQMEEKYQAYEKELQVEKVRSEFISNISHELKTPLSIIIATIQLLNKNFTNGNLRITGTMDAVRYITSIKQNAYRLVKLVNNIGELGKIESGYYDINVENVNIVQIVEEITLSVVEYIENKNIELIFDTSDEEVITAVDPEKIERIMLNLISNAAKHTDENGRILVNMIKKDEVVEISVTDNGSGISKEKLPFVFQRYVQADKDISKRRGGCGIGLALVKYLVEMQGGNITVESTEGVETRFTCRFPIKVVEKESGSQEYVSGEDSKVERCRIEFSDIYS